MRQMDNIINLKLLVVFVFTITILNSYSQNLENELSNIGVSPVVITTNNISTGLHEHSALDISPNGSFAFWTISLSGHKIILQLQKVNNEWSEPTVAGFSGQFRDEYHFFSPSGDSVYFMSYRPAFIGGSIQKHFMHWMTSFNGEKWTEPKINYDFHKEFWAYSMSKDKSVYGWCNLDTTKKDADIYFQEQFDGKYKEPELLSDSINSDAIEYCPCIAPDGSFIVFGRMGIGKMDGLYVSFRKSNNTWTQAKRLPEIVNQGYAERFPKISPDGKILFFNRQKLNYIPFTKGRLKYEEIIEQHVYSPLNGNGDIWGINTEILKME